MFRLPVLRKEGFVVTELGYQSQAAPNWRFSVTHTCGAQLTLRLVSESVAKSVRT